MPGEAASGDAARAPTRFVAVGVPAPVREAIERALETVRSNAPPLRWAPADGLHVTLAFLGPVADPAPVLPPLQAAAADLAPAEVAAVGSGRFGDRVLWVGVDDPSGALARAAEAVTGALVGDGIEVVDADRAFRPHVTVARAGRGRVRAAEVRRLEVPRVAWRVDRLALWSSVGGGRYEVDASVPLGG